MFTDNAQKYIDKALELMAQPCTTQTHKKSILEKLNHAYECERYLRSFGYETWVGGEHSELVWEVPIYLCHITDKSLAKLVKLGLGEERVAVFKELANLRQTAKDIEVIKRQPKAKTKLETLIDQFSKNEATKEMVKNYVEKMLPTTVKYRYVDCYNQDGHHTVDQWTRIDWYLNGTRTALSTIIAIAQGQEEKQGA